jgi:hypothetical protein
MMSAVGKRRVVPAIVEHILIRCAAGFAGRLEKQHESHVSAYRRRVLGIVHRRCTFCILC